MSGEKSVTASMVGNFETRFHTETNSAVVVFRFSDREPAVFLIPVATAAELGRSLVEFGEFGRTDPSQKN
jgi:hypothetical protein